MYPSEEFNYGGIFVKNQFDYLVKNFENHTFTIKAMKRKNSTFFGSVFKYIYFFISVGQKIIKQPGHKTGTDIFKCQRWPMKKFE